VNGIEFAVVISEPLGDGLGIEAHQAILGIQSRKGIREGSGNIVRRPVGDHGA
jgi:hypothetical protein